MININKLVTEAIAEQAEVNPEFKRLLASVMPRSPRYRYFSRSGSRDRYFWTVEKINHKGNPRYVAGVYRFLKVKKQFKLVKSSGFAKKYKAKERAKSWCDKEQSEKEV